MNELLLDELAVLALSRLDDDLLLGIDIVGFSAVMICCRLLTEKVHSYC